MKNKIVISIRIFLLTFIISFFSLIFFNKNPSTTLISPLSNIFFRENLQPHGPKQVIGFFPYWNLDKIDDVNFSVLTTVYYFAIDINGNGSFNGDDPGWPKMYSEDFEKLKTKVMENKLRFGLTIVNLDADSITQNVNNEINQNRLIKNTIKVMKEKGFTDLNIDLEYAGTNDLQTTKNYTNFVDKMTKAVKEEIPDSKVSIDSFADGVIKPRVLDVKKIGEIVDEVIIMAYDFHRINSIVAGPVAPLFGKGTQEYDVATSVSDYLTVLSPEKIILGVPFYGYEWPTEKNEKGSFVIKSFRDPELASYHRSLQTAKENNAVINFDDVTKSAWFSYYDKDSYSWRQVWFENERSLGLKFDLVNQAGLSGIGIWALGYDGSNAAPLWQTVKEKLRD